MLESANGCVLPSTDVVRPVNEIICREKRTIFRSPWNVHVQCNNIWFTCSQEPPLVFSERVEKVLQVPFKIFIGNESCWGDIITVTWRTWNIWCIGNGHVIIMRWKAPKWEHSDVEQKKKITCSFCCTKPHYAWQGKRLPPPVRSEVRAVWRTCKNPPRMSLNFIQKPPRSKSNGLTGHLNNTIADTLEMYVYAELCICGMSFFLT